MTSSRSRSPSTDGGWATPPASHTYGQNTQPVKWTSAKARSNKVNGFHIDSSANRGFLGRHFRKLSVSLPRFNANGIYPEEFDEKDKIKGSRWSAMNGGSPFRSALATIASQLVQARIRVTLLLIIVASVVLFYGTPLHKLYRRTSWLGGGSKFVIILAANQGGGVMEWKGPREWAIERDSVRNKRHYAKKWGYDLEIVDMATKKRYAHWRESWEKVDTMRRCMHEYPDAEWFWWLDLNTFIMEPSKSLQSHIFDRLDRTTYRDINIFNPLGIQHPPTDPYLDPIARSVTGDNQASSINMILPQDCSGFNLGSFFVRRSTWTDHLLDIWWDPVHYEQKHMQWEHKEQDAFEYLYTNQPWIRPHVAFIPQRMLSSFPPGACGENNETIHYREKDRDFLVNMAGCEWGRDCWGEMYQYRELSNRLNRSIWQKFKQDWLVAGYRKVFGKEEQQKE